MSGAPESMGLNAVVGHEPTSPLADASLHTRSRYDDGGLKALTARMLPRGIRIRAYVDTTGHWRADITGPGPDTFRSFAAPTRPILTELLFDELYTQGVHP